MLRPLTAAAAAAAAALVRFSLLSSVQIVAADEISLPFYGYGGYPVRFSAPHLYIHSRDSFGASRAALTRAWCGSAVHAASRRRPLARRVSSRTLLAPHELPC